MPVSATDLSVKRGFHGEDLLRTLVEGSQGNSILLGICNLKILKVSWLDAGVWNQL